MINLLPLELLELPIKKKNPILEISNDKLKIDFSKLLMEGLEEKLNNDNNDKIEKKFNLDIGGLKEEEEVNLDISEIINFKNELQFKEIKKIIFSELKQKNLLTSKEEIKNFKKIDNIADLIKFANKKELNIKKIEFKIAEIVKNKNSDIKNKNILEKNQIVSKNRGHSAISKTIFSKIENRKLSYDKDNKKVNLEVVLKKIDILKDKSKENSKKVVEDVISKDIEVFEKKKDYKNYDLNNKNENFHLKNRKENLNNNNLNNKVSLDSIIKEVTKENKDKKNNSNSENHTIILNNKFENSKIEIELKSKLISKTLESFKNNLDEAIKNYKPPISKVNIELNPQNLGKVEVTIIQRGNNIQLNLNSDTNNIMMFQTHQAEFRQALTNIGFSNIDMNFNSNQEKERKQNQAKKSYKDNEKNIENSAEIEIKANYRYA